MQKRVKNNIYNIFYNVVFTILAIRLNANCISLYLQCIMLKMHLNVAQYSLK